MRPARGYWSHILRAIFLMAILIGAPTLAGSKTSGFGNTVAQPSKPNHVMDLSQDSRWQVYLNDYGYPTDDPNLQLQPDLATFNSVSFLSEKVLVTTFLTRRSPIALQRHNDPNHQVPFHLHAFFLDASNGKVLKTLEWPLESAHAGIFPSGDGGFVFFSTEGFERYSANLLRERTLPLPQLKATGVGQYGLAAAPSGRGLLLVYEVKNAIQCVWVDSATLSTTESACTIPGRFTISDDETAAAVTPDQKNRDWRVIIGGKSEPWHELCDDKKMQDCRIPTFVAEKTIVVSNQYGFSVLDDVGGIQLHEKYKFLDFWIEPDSGPVRSSAIGNRFAVILNHLPYKISNALGGLVIVSGEVHFHSVLDLRRVPGPLPGRLDVYDLSSQTWFVSLLNKQDKFKEIFGFALSPSGINLAVDTGGVIHMYALPMDANEGNEPIKIH